MIEHVVFIPGSPLLIPDVDLVGDLVELRSAAVTALRQVCPAADTITIVGPAARAQAYGPGAVGSTAPLGVAAQFPLDPRVAADGARLPLSLTVGAWLLREIDWQGGRAAVSVPHSLGAEQRATLVERTAEPGRSTVLVVVGDGAATHGEKSPGYVNAHAGPFDEMVSAALAAVDTDALLAIPDGLASDVMCDGLAAWQLAAAAVGPGSATWTGRVVLEAVPFGVWYRVATWSRAEP